MRFDLRQTDGRQQPRRISGSHAAVACFDQYWRQPPRVGWAKQRRRREEKLVVMHLAQREQIVYARNKMLSLRQIEITEAQPQARRGAPETVTAFAEEVQRPRQRLDRPRRRARPHATEIGRAHV